MKNFLLLLLFVVSTTTLASPVLNKEFRDSFETGYVASKCGQNIMNLVSRADKLGVDLRSARIIKFSNGGYIMQGLFARNEGRRLPRPQGSSIFAPGVNPWYFHVVLEKDGKVYDYDYGNVPTIVSLKSYLKKMWIDIPADTGGTIVDKPRFREKYQIMFLSAQQYLDGVRIPNESNTTLKELYDSL